MANNKTYRKRLRGSMPNNQLSPPKDVPGPTASSSKMTLPQRRVNRAVVELELMPHRNLGTVPPTTSSVLPKERVGPPCGAKRLDERVRLTGVKQPDALVDPHPQSPTRLRPSSPEQHRQSSILPHPRSPTPPCPSSPLSPSATHLRSPHLSASLSPPLARTALANFPVDIEGEDEDSAPINDDIPLFLSDNGPEFDMGGLDFNEGGDDDDDAHFIGDDHDPAAGNEDENDVDVDGNDNDAEEEEIVSSMMTGGRFTHEQVLEVKDLAKTLMTTLGQHAKAWKRPLDAVMQIANLLFATKERRAGGNAWNAFQNAFPEDPDKATRK